MIGKMGSSWLAKFKLNGLHGLGISNQSEEELFFPECNVNCYIFQTGSCLCLIPRIIHHPTLFGFVTPDTLSGYLNSIEAAGQSCWVAEIDNPLTSEGRHPSF